MSWIGRLHMVYKLMYRFNTTTVKIPTAIFGEIDKLILKFIWKCKGHRRVKTILKKEQSWRTHTFQFQCYSNQDTGTGTRIAT